MTTPTNRRSTRLTLLAALYVSQAIPLGFFLTAMPVILRKSGLSLESVGLFSAIAAPWLLKFAWAPAIDRWSPGRRRYLSWVIPLQVASVATVLALAGLDLGTQLPVVVAVAAAFMLLAATQDVASDGLAVTVLAANERGLGNGLQVGGYYLGQILGGGVILMVFGRFGWSVALFAMALFLALPLAPAAGFREAPIAATRQGRAIGWSALTQFFRRPGAPAWALVVIVFRSGETMATYVFNQMMVDLGLPLTTIGLVSGVVYAVGALAGALTGGLLLGRVAREGAIVGFALAQAVATGAYLLVTNGTTTTLALAAFTMAFCGGMATTALYTRMMDESAPETAATDFTLQQSLAAIGPLAGTALSGFSAARLGYAGHYVLCAAISLATVALLVTLDHPRRPREGVAEA